MSLVLDISRCVRATSKFSECTKCIDASPEHIEIVDHLPTFSNDTGVEASACVGACPTEAFSLSDFSVTEFFFSFLESKPRLISSKVNIPCLSLLSVEHLVSLALVSEDNITLDLSSYGDKRDIFEQIESRIEEANFILSSFGESQIETNLEPMQKDQKNAKDEKSSQDISRRAFLKSPSLEGAVRQKQIFDDAVDAKDKKVFKLDVDIVKKIKDKVLPDKRKILFMALKRADKPDVFEILPEEEVSFISQKYVEDSCTNCQICYRICPTGALSSNGKFSLIHFDAMLCVKCHLCHDACEPESIKLQDGFEIEELFAPKQRILATFNIKRCNECGNNFTYVEGEQACPRCMVEEEEAMSLHNNAKLMRGDDI